MSQEKIIVEVDQDLEDLMPLFLSSREQDLVGLAQALASQNQDALRGIGHDMKGTGSSFGFHRVTEMGDQIEVAALAGDFQTIRTQFDLFQDFMRRYEIKYVAN